jgi:hypothetical protein
VHRVRNQHRGVRVRFEPSGNLLHLCVARLIFSDPNQADSTRDLEGPFGTVDRVGDILGKSLADSLGVAGNRRGPDECYRRAMTPSSTTPALKLS